MGYNLRISNKQKLSTLQKGLLIAGGTSVLTLAIYFGIGLNTADVSQSKAAVQLMVQDPINNGDVIIGFGWDEGKCLISEMGPDATDICMFAECINGGKDNTLGLSAGNGKKNLNLIIPATEDLNGEGLDIAIDYRRLEKTGDFYTRGKEFNFGMKDGKIAIKYKLTATNGKSYSINETTTYEIPEDLEYRNYRFIFSPTTGKGEILVDRVVVWNNQAAAQSKLTWNKSENIIIGNEMNGEGKPLAFFDNLIIRKTSSSSKVPMELLSFSADLDGQYVKLNWHTAKEFGTKEFIIEKVLILKTIKKWVE
ncbi:MAG: hypothetical protein IPK10_08325 [Bacteroidetes bacterium]|nr:hypothetical protein [Bacteroidota bacterium]